MSQSIKDKVKVMVNNGHKCVTIKGRKKSIKLI